MDKLYTLIGIILITVVLFIALNVIFNIVLKIAFFRYRSSSDLFVTKRFLSGCVGCGRGLMLFVIAQISLLFIGEFTGISVIQTFASSSPILFDEEVVINKISAFISGL